MLPAPATLQAGREGLSRLLAKKTLPDVVVCNSDTLAQGVLAEAASCGIKVPADIAVMGFGDLSTVAHVYPSLSTVRVDGARIGTETANVLLARFKAGGEVTKPGVRIYTGFTLVERQST